ncbi:metallophosphoesterase [Bacteroidota bacterium]
MSECFFVSDLHGRTDRYKNLIAEIEKDQPQLVFIGGDILPSGINLFSKSLKHDVHFINDFLIDEFQNLMSKLGPSYPEIYIILGNDDTRIDENDIINAEQIGIWHYCSESKFKFGDYLIIGYSFIPPSPFQLKDWEKYDVSRYVDPGCISPEEGRRTVEVENHLIRYSTIKNDLEELTGNINFEKLIFLFHSPPYKTDLDRAALDGKMIEHVPLDVHVGSIAIKKLIEEKQPYLTLHGHIHESTRLTGNWKQKIGRTISFNAAHDGAELSIIKFNLEDLNSARRKLI